MPHAILLLVASGCNAPATCDRPAVTFPSDPVKFLGKYACVAWGPMYVSTCAEGGHHINGWGEWQSEDWRFDSSGKLIGYDDWGDTGEGDHCGTLTCSVTSQTEVTLTCLTDVDAKGSDAADGTGD